MSASFSITVTTSDGRVFDVDLSFPSDRDMVTGLQETIDYVNGVFVGSAPAPVRAPAPKRAAAPPPAKAKDSRTKQPPSCRLCGEPGHNSRTCKALSKEGRRDLIAAAAQKRGAR